MSQGVATPPAQKAAMIAMAREGKTGAEISRAFGYENPRSAGVLLRRWGVYLRDNVEARHEELRAKIIKMFEAGNSRNEIWRKGIADRRTVQNAVREHLGSKPKRRLTGKPPAHAMPAQPALKVKMRFGFTPQAIKKYEARP